MQTETPSAEFIDSLKCPITYEFFRDPVIGADGHTYERENITLWIKKHASSPVTRQPMDLESLRPNFIVKKLVEDFVLLLSQKQYRFRLDIDIRKAKPQPIFQSPGKTIYEAQWISKQGPPIVLIRIDGAKAEREASFYVKLSCHPHIVRTYGLVDNQPAHSVMLVQEYAPHGDLGELLRSRRFQPNLEVLIEIFRQVVDAMICLADNQIIHGDLACRNTLAFRLTPDQPAEVLVKLTDFGLTRTSSLFSIIDVPASSTLKMIPVRSAAPELLADASPSKYSEKSDVYSFGVLMWEACSAGAIPYGDLASADDVYREKLNGRLLTRPTICSNELWNVIVACTQQESQKRPNFKHIQEALLRLRFEDKHNPYPRTSQVDDLSRRKSDIYSAPNTVPKEDLYQWYNAECCSAISYFPSVTAYLLDFHVQNSAGENHVRSPFYENLDNISNHNAVSYATHSAVPLGDYYIPCEYCLQSVDNDGFEAHQEVCVVRRAVRALVSMFVQLPLVEITACSYCEYLIPINMLAIHQNTCGQTAPDLRNTSHTPHHQRSLVDTYPTFNYLKPVSVQDPQTVQSIYENTGTMHPRIQKPVICVVRPPETPAQSSNQPEPPIISTAKPSKNAFRKAVSKFKKRIS